MVQTRTRRIGPPVAAAGLAVLLTALLSAAAVAVPTDPAAAATNRSAGIAGEIAAPDAIAEPDVGAIDAVQTAPDRLTDFSAATRRGVFWMYLAAFLGGILASLTPCVLPIIPLTITVIGARAAKSRARGFSLSLVYVLGIAVTYSTLGIVAASTGALFGSLFQSTLFLIFAVVLFTLLAFGLFGAYELQLPAGIRNRLMARQGQGFFGVFFMGLIAGLVASPCVGPIIVGILAFIAASQSILLGFTLLFTFSIGMGILFLVVGTFSSEIQRLPSGTWMMAIEYVLGTAMLAVSFYYLSILLDTFAFVLVLGASLVAGGAFAGAFTRLEPGSAGPWPKLGKAFGVLLVAAGLYFFIGGLMTYGLFLPPMSAAGPGTANGAETGAGTLDRSSSAEAGVVWNDDLEAALFLAGVENKPVMIDFTADWCTACHELDRRTFSDPAVVAAFSGFILVRIDMTDNTDPRNQEYTRRYEIFGLPSVTFLNPAGDMLGDFKVTGFMKAPEFLEILNGVREASKNP